MTLKWGHTWRTFRNLLRRHASLPTNQSWTEHPWVNKQLHRCRSINRPWAQPENWNSRDLWWLRALQTPGPRNRSCILLYVTPQPNCRFSSTHLNEDPSPQTPPSFIPNCQGLLQKPQEMWSCLAAHWILADWGEELPLCVKGVGFLMTIQG